MALVEAATTPVRIGLIGKYVQLPDAYLSVVESLKHAGFHHGAKVEVDWIQAEDVEGLLAAGRLAELDGIVIPGGFGARGVRGQDRRRPLRPRGGRAVPRAVPRPAGDDDRVRPQRARPDRRQLDGDGPDDAAPGDRPDARPARRHRQGRHDAPRRLLRGARAGHQGRTRPTASRSSASATATATSSTRTTGPASRRPGSCAAGRRPTAASSSSSSCATTRTGSAPRPTRSSRAGPTGRTRCSATSSAPPCKLRAERGACRAVAAAPIAADA